MLKKSQSSLLISLLCQDIAKHRTDKRQNGKQIPALYIWRFLNSRSKKGIDRTQKLLFKTLKWVWQDKKFYVKCLIIRKNAIFFMKKE